MYDIEIRARWDKLGFLEGLNPAKEAVVCIVFENLTKVLSRSGEKYSKIDSLVYALFRRLFQSEFAHNNKQTISELLDEFNDFFTDNFSREESDKHYTFIDYEVEFLRAYSELKIEEWEKLN